MGGVVPRARALRAADLVPREAAGASVFACRRRRRALLQHSLTMRPATDDEQLDKALDIAGSGAGDRCLVSHGRVAGGVPAMNYRGQGVTAALAWALIVDVGRC